jgi:hypothetical protein
MKQECHPLGENAGTVLIQLDKNKECVITIIKPLTALVKNTA